MKFSWYSSPVTDLKPSVTLWALMVMPRSRSRSIESRTCACISRASRPPHSWMNRSANVDLPWSTWAMIEKLRIFFIYDRSGARSLGKLIIIPVGDGLRAPYAPLRRSNAHGRPIPRRATIQGSCARNANAWLRRHRRRRRPPAHPRPRAVRRVRRAFPRKARSRAANTAEISMGGQFAAAEGLHRVRDGFDGLGRDFTDRSDL